MTSRWGAVFVCQGGALERKAVLLAASIRRHSGSSAQLVAAIPRPAETWQPPSDDTLAYLEGLGVRIADVENPIGEHYPIGNKFGCLAVMPNVERCFILDSDLLSLRPITADDLPAKPLAAKPEDRPGPWVDRRAWRGLYRWAGMKKWARSDEVITTVSGHRIPPYFNAGVVAIDPSSPVAASWLRWAQAIDSAERIPQRHPWLDQIALPLAARDVNVIPERLDEQWNWPAHHRLLRQPARFVHYHEPTVIEEDPMLWSGLIDLVRHDDELARLLGQDDDWHRVISRTAPLDRSMLMLLAGGPDSGIEAALERLRELGHATERADPSFVRRTHKDPDATGMGPWLRRFWLADSRDRRPLVLWDDTTLIRDADRVMCSVDGYSVAVWTPGEQGDRQRRKRRSSGTSAPRLRPRDLADAGGFLAWAERADRARSPQDESRV